MIILIIGFGSIAKKHIAELVKLLPDIRIYALRSGLNKDEHTEVVNIRDIKELPEVPKFIIISNPTWFHKSAIKMALNLGCPIFIEKPVMVDTQNAMSLWREIQQKGVLTYVACNMRFHPALLFIKEYLDQKKSKIEEVNIYCGSYLPDWRPGEDFKKSYSANIEMGGGVHLDLIHELDYCKWLFGIPFSVSSLKRSKSSLRINAVDYANYIFSYADFIATITLNYYRKAPKRTLEIITADDVISIDLIASKISSLVSGKVIFESNYNISDTYLAQLKYFLDCIDKNEQPMNSFFEGVQVLNLALYE